MKEILKKQGKIFTLRIIRDEDFDYVLTLSILGISAVEINLNDVFENLSHKKKPVAQ